MKKVIALVFIVLTFLSINYKMNAAEIFDEKYPIGEPGQKLTYSSEANDLPVSVVHIFTLTVGTTEEINGIPHQWIWLNAEKGNKETFSVWILATDYPSAVVTKANNVW